MLRFTQLSLLLGALHAWGGAAVAVRLPVIQLADAFPFTVAGVGAREWLGLRVLSGQAMAPEAVVAAVFLQNAVSNLLPGVPGCCLLFSRGRGKWFRVGRRGTPRLC